MISLSRSSEVRVKVAWDLKFQKWRFSKSISSAIFQPIQKIQTVSNTRPKYLKSLAGCLNFFPVIESCDFKICQKNRLRPILVKLGMMLEVDDIHDDMTFKVIRGQGQGEEMTSVPYRDYFFLLCVFILLFVCAYMLFLFICIICTHSWHVSHHLVLCHFAINE